MIENADAAKVFLEVAYLLAALSFVFGLKMMSHPKTARQGNAVAAAGMGIAILATIVFLLLEGLMPITNLGLIIAGLGIGSIAGTWTARKVPMTAMPQMVSLFNGMGGACVALISLVEVYHFHPETWDLYAYLEYGSILLGTLIGSISFSGSIIAWGKLEGKISDKWARIKGINLLNALLLLVTLGYGFYIWLNGDLDFVKVVIFFALAVLYGITFVLPIGGADMPVVISLLNSFTGTAAAFAGFAYDNMAMIIGGILVGSAGTLLTILMTRAMNRSLMNVLLGAIVGGGAKSAEEGEKNIKEVTPQDAGIMLAYANKVIFVPGYGLAVAQAQHALHELEKLLEERGVEVKYAIHPVAGRMPGHMNVLLAEADVPYDKLLELEQANQEFPTTDVVVIIGANDVVNPAAEQDPSSPIYGMPILQAYKAKNVIVIKRSMRPGYAGIDNPLFYMDNTRMLFADAKKAIEEIIKAIQEL